MKFVAEIFVLFVVLAASVVSVATPNFLEYDNDVTFGFFRFHVCTFPGISCDLWYQICEAKDYSNNRVEIFDLEGSDCNKNRAVQALSVLAILFEFFALVALLHAGRKGQSQTARVSSILLLIGLAAAIAASVIFGEWAYKNDPKFGYSFILMCVAVGLGIIDVFVIRRAASTLF